MWGKTSLISSMTLEYGARGPLSAKHHLGRFRLLGCSRPDVPAWDDAHGRSDRQACQTLRGRKLARPMYRQGSIMYSKAKVLGHPVHPMLVSFPIAFYTATLIAYGVYAATDNRFWFQLGVVANFAGVVTALAAAIPGFIDWAFGIPAGHP